MLHNSDGDPSGPPAKECDSNSLEQVCHLGSGHSTQTDFANLVDQSLGHQGFRPASANRARVKLPCTEKSTWGGTLLITHCVFFFFFIFISADLDNMCIISNDIYIFHSFLYYSLMEKNTAYTLCDHTKQHAVW